MKKNVFFSFADLNLAKIVKSLQNKKDIFGMDMVTRQAVEWADSVIAFFTRLYQYAKKCTGHWCIRIKIAWEAARENFQDTLKAVDLTAQSAAVWVEHFSKFTKFAMRRMAYLMFLKKDREFRFVKEDGSTRVASGHIVKISANGVILFIESQTEQFRSFRIERLILPLIFSR